jgi:hypothetical protein
MSLPPKLSHDWANYRSYVDYRELTEKMTLLAERRYEVSN